MSEWISIKDRLPEKSGWYLTYAPTWYNQITVLYNSKEFGFCGTHGHPEGEITHWAELPEPPEEGKNKMISTTCDICEKEAVTEKHTICSRNIYGGYTQENLNVCSKCMTDLRNWKNAIESAFYNNGGDTKELLHNIYLYVWHMYNSE